MALPADFSPPRCIPFDWEGFFRSFADLTGVLTGQEFWELKPGASFSFEIVDGVTTYPPDNDAGNMVVGALTGAPLAGDLNLTLHMHVSAGQPMNCQAFCWLGDPAGSKMELQIIISPYDDPPARIEVTITFPGGASIDVVDIPFAYDADHTITYRVIGATESIVIDGGVAYAGARHSIAGIGNRTLTLWGFGDSAVPDTMIHYASVSFTT